MAYPPDLPPATRTDSTLSAVNHARDHNLAAAALRDLVDELGANPAGLYASVTERLLGISAAQDAEAIRTFLDAMASVSAAATAAGASATSASSSAALAAAIAIGDVDAAIAALVANKASAGGQALAALLDERVGYLNVKTFGAKGDGATDDTAAIAAAYAALAPGATLVIPPGTYLARITPPSGSRTIAYGATLKAPTGSTAVAVNLAGKTGVTIEGLAVNGNSVAVHGVHTAAGTTDLVLTDVEVYGCTERGVWLENVTDAQLTRVLARNNGASNNSHAGIGIMGQRITLTDCVARNNTVGFRVVSSTTMQTTDVTLKGCIGHDSTRYNYVANAGDFTLRPTRITLNGCISKGTGNGYSGFAMHGVTVLTLIGCVSTLAGEHAITVQDSREVTLIGCVMASARIFALRLQGDFSRPEDAYTGVRGAVVSGCLMVGNGTANAGTSSSYGGVFIDTGGEDILITGNLIYGNTGSGLWIANRANFTDPLRVVCNGNVLRNNVAGGTPYTVVLSNLPTATRETYSGFNYENGPRRGFGVPPAVTGSRGGNAALAALLTELAAQGLITNNTTA